MAPKSPWKKSSTVPNEVRAAAGAQGSEATVNYGEVQNDETEVLKAIYMEDYQDVETKGAWSKTTDRNFNLKLRAPSHREDFVMLSIRLTATYPKTLPLLEVTGLGNYHERTQKRIRNIVQNRPKQLVNDVMIHAIATEIEDALEDAAMAREQGTLPSLEEERASAEEVASAQAKELQEAEARGQREAQEEEDRVLKQMVNEELSRREKKRPSKPTPRLPESADVVTFDQPAALQLENETLKFDTVVLLTLLSQSRDEELQLGKPRLVSAASSPLVAIKSIKTAKDRDEIMQIESLLDAVRKVRHNNILGLLAFRVNKLDSATSSVVLCSEYADRGTLHDALELGAMHVGKARQYTIELLEALDCIHRNGVAHGSLATTSIYLDSIPALHPKIGSLGNWMLTNAHSNIPLKWRAPEIEDTSMASRRKSDVWNLGVVVVQIFTGLGTLIEYHSPQAMLSRMNISDAFNDFLRAFFTADSRKRPSAFDLLPMEFLRIGAGVMGLHTSVPSTRSDNGAMSPLNRHSRHNSSNVLEPMSRYATDFTEIGRLGKGGFGEVVKARNKLDGGVYAVKKIKQAPQLLGQVLSEVMLLNRLNHPYVVRYFSTWVENDVSWPNLDDLTSTTETMTEETEEAEDSSSDGPRMDFGYQSTGGLDFVSSSGYPQIEFGVDEEDGSGDSVVDDDEDGGKGKELRPHTRSTAESHGNGALSLKKTRSDSQRLPSILYIQMEYCERHTLRDLVRRGMSEDDAWRYVRQITEGLAHIHSHGIIHRDLKPDNIFIDMAGNPKIGDFGLAITSQYHTIERAATMSGQSGGDLTRSVGTTLYVAPELRSASNETYNEKVDMYSLGIIFYEMCQEFGTAMERIRALQQIREKNHELPPAYQANGEKAAQGRLVSCLISHKPSERPSSNELLRSDVLPLKIEDETIRQALTGLSDPRSPYHQKMMSALFARDALSVNRVKALAWDAKSAGSLEDGIRLRIRAIARTTLESIFRRHGAEEARRQSVFPRSGFYISPNVVQLLDASGNLLQLPYDLTLPCARQLALARQPADIRKTYIFGNAYRDDLTGGPPRVSEEVDFDISGSMSEADTSLDDAEVIKVIDEAVCDIPFFASSTAISFHINNSLILDVVLEHCRIPTPSFNTVKEAISRLGFHKFWWPKARSELRKLGLPDTTLDDLQHFDFRDSPEKAFGRLQSLLRDATPRLRQRLDEGISSLMKMLHVLSQFSIQRSIYVTPLGSVNAKFYEDGLLFQCVLERRSDRAVIAAGGRYDSLIRAHRTRDGPPTTIGAIGVAIGLDPIIRHMTKNFLDSTKAAYLKDKPKAPTHTKRCNVAVVASGSEGVRDAGIKLLTTLWTSDISAELSSIGHTSTEMAKYDFVVAIRHEASSTVRVQSVGSDGEEIDVPISGLVSHIQQELRDREPVKVRQPAFVRQTSHHHDGERKANVQVLLSQHRSKKSNKYHIVDAAQRKWSEKIEEWKNAPILAVETRDDVLESLRETRLSDGESWRKAIHGVQLNERQYVQEIMDILTAWRKQWTEADGQREVCIFNFRSGHSIYYDVGV